MHNPYETPGGTRAAASPDATLRVLAAIGAWAASGYWALLTLIIGLAAATRAVSPAQLIFPILLIALYAVRGYQIFKGDPAAANRIILLHVIGGVSAVVQIASTSGLFVALQSIKIGIHIFGGVTAYLWVRARR